MNENYCSELPVPEKNILYVVFHGELAFFDTWNSDSLRVYAPVIPSYIPTAGTGSKVEGQAQTFASGAQSHVYAAGPWLAERHIPRGATLALQGVHQGDKTLGDSNILRLRKNFEARPVAAYFEIRVPRPDDILTGFLVGCKVSAAGDLVSQDQMDLRPVFKYRMKTSSAFLCDLDDESNHDPGTPAKNWGAGEGCPGYYSLHVFAEEDSLFTDIDTEAHAEGAFHTAGHILGVNNVSVSQGDSKLEHPVIPGLHPSETLLTLSGRTLVLAKMGRQLRQGHKYLVFDDSDETTEKALRSNNHSSCGPVGN